MTIVNSELKGLRTTIVAISVIRVLSHHLRRCTNIETTEGQRRMLDTM